MYARPNAPRTIGGVLDDAVSLYRSSLPAVWVLALGASLLLAIPSIAMRRQLASAAAGGPAAMAGVMSSPGYVFSSLVILLIYSAMYGAVLFALDRFAAGAAVASGAALARGLRLLPRMIVVTLLVGLMVGIGSLLLLIPGIYLWGIFQLAFVALIVEDARIGQSLGISRGLIKGYWWRSATLITVAFIIVIVFSLIAGLVSGALVALLGFASTFALIVQTLISCLINVVLFSLVPCFLLSMYYDLKLRHEGGDLAARIDALGAR